MKDLYIVNCCRTAIGSFGGSLLTWALSSSRKL